MLSAALFVDVFGAAMNSFGKSFLKDFWQIAMLVLVSMSSGASAQDCLYNYAITHGDVQNIRNQIATDPDLNINCEGQYGEYTGLTSLMVTALYGIDSARAQIASLIIKAGGDVNHRQLSDGSTALMDAAMGDAEPVAKVLLTAGAQINLRNKNGFSALNLAIQYRSLEMVKTLCKSGADLNFKDPNGRSALAEAIYYNADNENYAEALISCGADIHESLDGGGTLLISAVEARPSNIALVKLLIAASADVNRQTKQGLTALMAAATTDSADKNGIAIAQVLLEAGAIPVLTGTDPRFQNLCNNCDALAMARTYRMIWIWTHSFQDSWQETQMIWFLHKSKKGWLKKYSR